MDRDQLTGKHFTDLALYQEQGSFQLPEVFQAMLAGKDIPARPLMISSPGDEPRDIEAHHLAQLLARLLQERD